MREAGRYRVDTATDSQQNLKEVLEYVATLPGHLRIVSITWQPARPSSDRALSLFAGYTIVSEMDVSRA